MFYFILQVLMLLFIMEFGMHR